MDRIPGQLDYEVIKFLPIKSYNLVEMFSKNIYDKLRKNHSALQYLLRRYYSISQPLSYIKSKKAIYGIANPACYYF
jgi:hypothetical protein